MTTLVYEYATDEDIVLRFPKDFGTLCPKPQTMAAGNDGVFTSSERWVLRSALGDFVARGIKSGQVVRLVSPSSVLRPLDDLLVIDSAENDSILLRRPGQPLGVGLPPGALGGMSGVEYMIPTLQPQIQSASRELARRYGIDEQSLGKRSRDLVDVGALRDATVLSVVQQRYLDLGRGSGGGDDPFITKAEFVAKLLDTLLAREAVWWAGHHTKNLMASCTRVAR